jgi:hypothetical protein
MARRTPTGLSPGGDFPVSRVRNEYQKLLADYKRDYKPLFDKIRNRFVAGGRVQVPPALDDALEFHARTYIVNALLAALN